MPDAAPGPFGGESSPPNPPRTRSACSSTSLRTRSGVVAAGVDPEPEAEAAGVLAEVVGEDAGGRVLGHPVDLGRRGQQQLPGPGGVLAVGDLQRDLDPAAHGRGGVGHHLGEQELVGDDHELAVGGAQPGRPDLDLLHLALGLGDGDVVALGEGVLEQQHDAGGEVADDVLEGEAEGDGGQAEAADQDPEVDPAEREGDHQPDRDRGVEGQGGHHDHDVALGAAAPQRPLDRPAHHPGHHRGEPEGDQGGQHVRQPLDEPLGELLERVGQPLQRQGVRRVEHAGQRSHDHGRTASS